MNDLNSIILNIAQSAPGFLLAVVIHEAAHAWMANKFGDPTAKNEGRLSLNPAVHYDPWGTIFFPLLAAFGNWGVIGWAKPVPIEVRNFKKIRQGIFWVSFAGPLSNLVLGTFLALVFGFVTTQVPVSWGYYSIALRMLDYAVMINFILAFFNLIPLPPLDGSRMISTFLKGEKLRQYEQIAAYTPAIFIVIMLLSFMGIHTIGYLLLPAQYIGKYLMYSSLNLFASL